MLSLGYDVSAVAVEHPEQFPVIAATAYETTHEMVVTGTVNPDIARTVPVISLASGRVVAIHARLGDTVKKGQVLLTIRSDDMSGPFSDYRKAIADEILARTQLEQKTAYGFILAGATALGIGKELVSSEAIHLRQEERIRTLSDRFRNLVNDARNQKAGR